MSTTVITVNGLNFHRTRDAGNPNHANNGQFSSGGGGSSVRSSNASGRSSVKLDLRKPLGKQYHSAGMSREEAHADLKKRGYNDAVISKELKGFDRARKS